MALNEIGSVTMDEMKRRTHGLYGLDPIRYPSNAFDSILDVTHDDFMGLTPRQAYVNVSKLYFKPVHGVDFFGEDVGVDPAPALDVSRADGRSLRCKVIFLHGPPRVGKDTAARFLNEFISARVFGVTPTILSLARLLKERTHAFYGLDPFSHPAGAFELVKDQPRKEFMGLTPRQAYINVSELYLKPVHGVDFLGRVLADVIEVVHRERAAASHSDIEAPLNVFMISDSGFTEELDPIIAGVGSENCLLVRIHWVGRGVKDFSNDSRNWIHRRDIDHRDIVNAEGCPWVLEDELRHIAVHFLQSDLPQPDGKVSPMPGSRRETPHP